MECHESVGSNVGFPGNLYFIWTVHTPGTLGNNAGAPQLMGRLATQGFPVLTLEGVPEVYGTTSFLPDVPNANVALTAETGGCWSPSSERRVHVAACDSIGVYFRPNHVGRHAFGTHALKRTRDIYAVQKVMRHADPRTTEGYIDREVVDIAHVPRPRKHSNS
jgi:hypothetical protein